MVRAPQGGFTLLEVLIASILLFVSIGLVSVAYQMGLKTDANAQRHLRETMAYRFLEAEVNESLRVKPDDASGKGTWGSIEYQWEVVDRVEKYSKAGFDSESGSGVQLGRLLVLYQIKITTSRRDYEYAHLSWE